jgi:hypothetical protein
MPNRLLYKNWAVEHNIASIYIKQSTAMGLLMHPLGRQDQELLQERLPPPMHAVRGCVYTKQSTTPQLILALNYTAAAGATAATNARR